MKCFIHPTIEAQGVCRECGKGMCVDCSSFDKHSGYCPNCKRAQIQKYCNINLGGTFLSIGLSFTSIGLALDFGSWIFSFTAFFGMTLILCFLNYIRLSKILNKLKDAQNQGHGKI